MALKFIYITNNPEVALIAEESGVEIIFVDMEYIGKDERQKGLNSVKNHHTVEDVKRLRSVVKKARLTTRVNPIHEQSREEIDAVVEAGVDSIILPYFKTVEEVKTFFSLVNGRCGTCLLFETAGAVKHIDEILSLPEMDKAYIGLNDLTIDTGRKFMFEPLADGTVDYIVSKFVEHNISFGFGGIASLGRGMLPSEYIIREHYRLGSECVILSRSFCNANNTVDPVVIKSTFKNGIQAIRDFEEDCQEHPEKFEVNRRELQRIVKEIVDSQ